MRGIFLLTIALFFALPFMPAVSCADGENLRGWVVGEKCVKAGKIGDCYLKWAYPAVIWTESGDTYRIELVGEGLDETSVDKAFGKEVEVEGWVSENQVMVVKMTVLDAAGKKEFFKG